MTFLYMNVAPRGIMIAFFYRMASPSQWPVFRMSHGLPQRVGNLCVGFLSLIHVIRIQRGKKSKVMRKHGIEPRSPEPPTHCASP